MDFFLLSQEPAFAKLSFLKTFVTKFYGVNFVFGSPSLWGAYINLICKKLYLRCN